MLTVVGRKILSRSALAAQCLGELGAGRKKKLSLLGHKKNIDVAVMQNVSLLLAPIITYV